MSTTLQFDDDASRRIEAIYSTPDVVAQRQAVLLVLQAKPGERVLDIGAGPGFLAAELAAAVAPDGAVIGTDISETCLRSPPLDSTRPTAQSRHVSSTPTLVRSPSKMRASTRSCAPKFMSMSETSLRRCQSSSRAAPRRPRARLGH